MDICFAIPPFLCYLQVRSATLLILRKVSYTTITKVIRWNNINIRIEFRDFSMGAPVFTFNTLRFANQLKAAGILSAHAEAEAEAIAEAFEVNFKDLATKEDLKSSRTDIDAKFKSLYKEFEALRKEFRDLRGDFTGLQKEFESLSKEFRDLRGDFAGLRKEFDISASKTKIDLIKWIVTLLAAQSGLLIGFMMKFMKLISLGPGSG